LECGLNKSTFLLADEIASCTKCPRLVTYCASFLGIENPKYPGFEYWAKPVPGFGDPKARLLIIGLAPGAQGANRTGRPFTGDGAGEVLYRALYKHGFANRDTVVDRNDGLALDGVYITNAVKCVPPQNRPIGSEKQNCLPWLIEELPLLKHVEMVLAMGKDAFDSYLRLLKLQAKIEKLNAFRFAHEAVYTFDQAPAKLLATYHFSRYNINTGVLTEDMIDKLFVKIKGMLR
jgi:uracil-DNA glycosylase